MTTQPIAAGTPAATKPAVAVQGLTRIFKDFWLRDRARAVDDLTFQINQGEIFGLLGPNGSGKSTTIKILLGLLRPTRGRVVVFGKPPSDVAVKKRIGYLPEESYLYPFLNARETLDYYGRIFGLDAATREARTDELIDMVGLTHAAHRQVREYSKGMQRRIGIAQALINDPDLLILDEPTTGLDPIGTRQVKDLILELGRRGKTVLLSSHLLADVQDCVDRMVILYGGKKRDEGTGDDLLTSRERTTIEVDALDEDTIAAIDQLIRQRSGGDKAVLSVSHPRQTLEQKFLQIVEQARTQQVQTSVVTHGGTTASFLKADDGGAASGDALLQQLTDDGSEEIPETMDIASRTADETEPTEAGDAVIEALVGGGAAAEDEPASEAIAPPSEDAAPEKKAEQPKPSQPDQPAEADDDIIGALLDGGAKGDDAPERDR
ncbi:MAG: ATP-binding cassette domain-containing protein [Planctomycetota bacterium]